MAQEAQASRAGEAAARQNAALKRRKGLLRTLLFLLGLGLLLGLLNVATHGDFLAPGNVLNILRQIAVNAILAIGQTFVIITAGIDLSVGSLIALSGVLMAGALNAGSGAPSAAVLAAAVVGLGIGALAGLVNGFPVVRFNLPPFITTLAMMLMARGLAFLYTSGHPIELDNSAFNFVGSGFLAPALGHLIGIPGIPMPVTIMLCIVVIANYALAQTRFGRYVYAIGGNEEAARLSGINVAAVKLSVYIVSGALAGLASLLLTARLNAGIPQSGQGYELQSIAAVVVGGTSLMGGRGSIAGTFIGALLIGVLYNLMNLLNVQSYAQEVVLGTVILFAVLLDELRKRIFAARA
jgi:ribose/xylose/arabinose/galactoside ABC-type transport system permease subunit